MKYQVNEKMPSSFLVDTGKKTVVISTDTQRITLKHEAMDRRLFAEGACCAFRFISGRAPGLYDMADMVKNEN